MFEIRSLNCPACGAALEASAVNEVLTCPFCGSCCAISDGTARDGGGRPRTGYPAAGAKAAGLVQGGSRPTTRGELSPLHCADNFNDSELLQSPAGSVSLLLRALLLLDDDEAVAQEALACVLARPTLEEYETERLLRELKSQPHIVRSYLGGTPTNGYQCSPLLVPDLVHEACTANEREATVVIQSSGRRYASKIRLKRNKHGHWKVCEWSDLGIGVTPAVGPDDGDF